MSQLQETVAEVRVARELPYMSQSLSRIRTLLDIGCGPAQTSIALAKTLDLDYLYLMDGIEGPKLQGYHDEPKPWFDTAITAENAKRAGLTRFMVVPCDPTATYKVDAIISLLSWGHHYPVSTYIELAKRSLPVGGLLILDLRRAKDGEAELHGHGFRMIAMLDATPKMERFLFQKVK